MKREAPRGGASLFLWQPPRREQGRISCIVQQQGDKLEVSVAYLDFYIKPLFFASSINIGWIKGYVQLSTNLSEINIFSISQCNSTNELMSAINNIPKVSSSIFSFTRVFPLTEYTHIGSILKSIAPVSSCNSLLAVSKILYPGSLWPPGTS